MAFTPSKQQQHTSLHSQKSSIPATLSPRSSSASIRSDSQGLNTVWNGFRYPTKWELSDDFMCVHFIPRTADKATWSSQCTFWSEAISLYANQLLFDCPFKYDRLTFTASDIKRVYTRKNRLTPMCIIDIFKFMQHSQQNNIILASFIEENYSNHTHSNAHKQRQRLHKENETNHSSLLSISGMSSMVHSMFEYFVPSSHTNSDDESDSDSESEVEIVENAKNDISENTKICFVPLLNELCDQMKNLNFFKKSMDKELSQLIEIGIIDLSKQNKENSEFIMNGLLFYRFCAEILHFTVSDVQILKKYMMFAGIIKVFYLNDDDLNNLDSLNICQHFSSTIVDLHNVSFHDLKNEMIWFNANNENAQITQEQITKMQMLSIQITMKHLKFQKDSNQHTLAHLNNEILTKLKNVPSEKRMNFMQSNKVLLQRKKLLKNRISSLDGSIYNLETTLHSMEDMKINKMVFNEMKNADKMLKSMIKSTPSINELHGMREDLNKSMQINEEIGDVLSAQMMNESGLDIDNDVLLKEYDELEMQNAKELLPNAPSHDIVIADKAKIESDSDVDTEIKDKAKDVMLN